MASTQDNPMLESMLIQSQGKDPELVNPDNKYVCPVHKGLIRDPIQTLCGHRLCRACVVIYLNGQESKLCPVEDEERELVTLKNILPDPGFLREMKTIDVYCFYKDNGCTDIIKYRNLDNHTTRCIYQPSLCPYNSRGCRQEVVWCRQSMHVNECGFKPVFCSQCGQEFNRKDLQDHEKRLCPEAIIACPYNCKKKMKRRKLEDHLGVCPMKPKECQYKILGCSFTGNKAEIERHEMDFETHFERLVTFVCELKVLMTQLPTPDNQRLIETKQRMDRIDDNFQRISRDTKESQSKQEKRITALESNVLAGKEDVGLIKEQMREINQSMDHTKLEIQAHSKHMNNIEVRLAENDLRFQIIETSSFDGNLLWKIRDVDSRRKDAAQGRTVSLYSQPFYTGRFGYKMCARVYLNGDGIGKGTHVSLYFVVMKGEYDALLPWPFQLKIKLILLDQSQGKRHLKDEFVPDRASTSFKRPEKAEMNVASGCPLFVAHSVIDDKNNKYIYGDTMFIMVSVDCSGIPNI